MELYMCVLPALFGLLRAMEIQDDHKYDINGVLLNGDDYLRPFLEKERSRAKRSVAEPCFRGATLEGTEPYKRKVEVEVRQDCSFGTKAKRPDKHRAGLFKRVSYCAARLPGIFNRRRPSIPMAMNAIFTCMKTMETIAAYCGRLHAPSTSISFSDFGETPAEITYAEGLFTKHFRKYDSSCGYIQYSKKMQSNDHLLAKWIIKVDRDSLVNVTVLKLNALQSFNCEGAKLMIFESNGNSLMTRIGTYCGKPTPFSVVSKSSTVGIVYRSPHGRTFVENIEVQLYYEAILRDRVEVKKNTQNPTYISHLKKTSENTILTSPFLTPSTREIKFTCRTYYGGKIRVWYQVTRRDPFGGKSKNLLLVYNGPDEAGSIISQAKKGSSYSYLSDSFQAHVKLVIKDQVRTSGAVINIETEGHGDSLKGLQKASIPRCKEDGDSLSTDKGECIHSITNDKNKFFKIFIRKYSLFYAKYTNLLEEGCPYMGFVIFEGKLNKVIDSQEYFGPFCQLMHLETTMEKMPFYVSTSDTMVLYLYSFHSERKIKLFAHFEQTSCQGFPDLGNLNQKHISDSSFVYTARAAENKKILNLKTGKCLYVIHHKFLVKGESKLEVHGPAAYELTIESAISGRRRWQTNGDWVYNPKKPEDRIEKYYESEDKYDRYDDIRKFEYYDADYSMFRPGYFGGHGAFWGGGFGRGFGGFGGYRPTPKKLKERKITVYLTDLCEEEVKFIKPGSGVVGEIKSTSTKREKGSISVSKLGWEWSTTCKGSMKTINSLYLRAEADDCMDSTHDRDRVMEPYQSSCAVITLPTRYNDPTEKRYIMSFYYKLQETDSYYFNIEVETVHQYSFFAYCQTQTTSSVTITEQMRTDSLNLTTSYQWKNKKARKMKWSTRTHLVTLEYSRKACQYYTHYYNSDSKAATIKFQAVKYEIPELNEENGKCEVFVGLASNNLPNNTYETYLVNDWDEAHEICKKKGGYLWNIETKKELETVLSIGATKGHCGRLSNIFKHGVVAIGLERDNRDMEFRWSEGNQATFYEWMKKTNKWDESHATHYPDIDISSSKDVKDLFKTLHNQKKNVHDEDKVVMAVFTPTSSTHWVKVKGDYKIKNLVAVCETGRDFTTEKSAQLRANLKDPAFRKKEGVGIQSTGVECDEEWFAYNSTCVMLLSMYFTSFMIKSTPKFNEVTANDVCKIKGGSLMRVGQADMHWLSKMLTIWKHGVNDGPVWIKQDSTENCTWVNYIGNFSMSGKNHSWGIEPGNCSSTPTHESEYHVLCEDKKPRGSVRCPGGTRRCRDGSCIDAELWCDGTNNCPGREDEIYCSAYYLGRKSPIREVKINKELNEDGNTTYVFRQVPSLAGTLFFRCSNGEVIPGSKVCNSKSDCSDNSDEMCVPQELIPWCYTDVSCDSTKCISDIERCNKKSECTARSDEADCGDYCEKWECSISSCDTAKVIRRVGLASVIKEGCHQPISYRGNESWTCGIYNPTFMPCGKKIESPEAKECYPRAAACHLTYGNVYCDGQPDFTHCTDTLCPGKFKCYNDFCIDKEKTCDGRKNCPNGEDEMLCDGFERIEVENPCKGKFRCTNNKCLSVKLVCNGQADCEDGIDERMCRTNCPRGCSCIGMAMSCPNLGWTSLPTLSQEMRILLLPFNNIPFTKATFRDFPRLFRLDLTGNGITSRDIQMNFNVEQDSDKRHVFGNLRELILRVNNVTVISSYLFSPFRELRFLDLRENPLYKLEKLSFHGVHRLTYLYLEEMVIEEIEETAFTGLSDLVFLNLSHNNIKRLSERAFEALFTLHYLDLRYNPLELVHEKTFESLAVLKAIHTPGFQYCCVPLAADVQCTHPPIEYSSCSDLLASTPLRFCIWILALLAFLGNLGVILWRRKEEQKTALSFVIRHLGVADLLMGMYLLIIAGADLNYRGNYYLYDSIWRRSNICRFAGFISMLSSEMSVYVLCLITADRIAVIALGWDGFTRHFAQFLVYCGWFIWSMLSFLPILNLEYFGSGNYIKHGVCFLFNLTEGKVDGWEYATAIFIVFNMFALLFLGVGYTGTFISIICRTGITGTMEVTIARKLLLVVLTDCLCWIPPIVIGIMSLRDETVDPKVAMWVAVLIFPINSSLNPFLYTFTTMRCDEDRSSDSYASSASFTNWESEAGDIGLGNLQREIDADRARALGEGSDRERRGHGRRDNRRISKRSKRKNTWAKNQRMKQMVSEADMDDPDAPGTSGNNSQMQIDLSMSVAIRGNELENDEEASIASVSNHTIPLSRSRSLKVKQTTQINTIKEEVKGKGKGHIKHDAEAKARMIQDSIGTFL